MALAAVFPHRSPKRFPVAEAAAWLPALLSLLLAIPCFRFTLLFDDFDFLARGRHFTVSQLLPDPGSTFYRPLSRELYFALLSRLDAAHYSLGHAINAAVIALTVLLMVRFASRLAGDRAGLHAGLFLALLAPVPFLVGWISGIQDVLALAFLMAAFNCRLSGRDRWAIAFSALALLSKETSICLFPAIAAMPSVLDRDHARTKRSLAAYLALALAWAGVNPRVLSLIAHGAATGSGGYVGLDNPGGLENLRRMAFATMNVPERIDAIQRTPDLERILPVALAVLLVALWAGYRKVRHEPGTRDSRRTRTSRPPSRVILLGVLMAAVPALATALSVKHWAPYYACIPALGVSLVAALALSRLGVRVAAALVVLFLAMGVLCRESDDGGRFGQCERAWSAFSSDMTAVERGMKSLHPTLPSGAAIYVSIHLPIDRRIHSNLLHYQAPRTWFGRPDIEVRPAGRFDPGAGPAVIFWISPSCEVFEIAYPSLQVRARQRPAYDDYQRAVRLLALGVFRAGDVERASAMILNMDEPDPATRSFDRRLAGAFCLAAGKNREAACALRGLPPADRLEALHDLVALLGPAGSRENLGPAALQAFGVPVDDPEIWRCLMHAFLSAREIEPAWRMARQVRALLPNDMEAGQVIDWVARIPRPEPVTTSVEVVARR